MNILEWFQNRWKHEAVHYTYKFIDMANVKGRTMPSAAIRSGENYFRITLAEMFLKNDVDWFTSYAPAVYSLVKLSFGNKEETLTHVAGPSGLKDLQAKSLNKGVTINYSLTPWLPFNGGDIELEAGLVALPGSNDARRFLKVLSDFSTTLAIPQLSLALSFAQPLANGIAELVGAEETKLVLRLHDKFSQGGNLRPGYLAIISEKDGKITEPLWVKEDRLHKGATMDSSTSLEGYDYALFRLDSTDERDDYHALSAIDGPYQEAITALNASILEFDPQKKQDKLTEAERFLGAAKLAAFQSKELTFKVGRRQVIEALQKSFNEAKALLASGAGEQDVARNLKTAMVGAMPFAEAKLAGEVTAADL